MKKRLNAGYRALISLLLICTVIICMAPSCYAIWTGSPQEATKGVVRILSTNSSLDQIMDPCWGSGFGVGKAGQSTEYFVTNRHVVWDERNGTVYRNVYIVLEDGAVVEAADVSTGYSYYAKASQLVRCEVLYPLQNSPAYPDIAILRAERVVTERIALPLKSGLKMDSGDKIYTLGFPGSADEILIQKTQTHAQIEYPASVSSVTVADGVISKTVSPATLSGTTVFQHTAAMNGGSSGGPLLDEKGYVIGINTYGYNESDNGVAEYKYSIYINYAMDKLDYLKIDYDTDGLPVWAWILIGVGIAAVIAGIAVAIILLVKGGKSNSFRLQGLNGAFAGRRFAIKGRLRIGRDPARNDLTFPPDIKVVSGAHCVIEVNGKNLTIRDLDSKNGTFVNGSRIMSGVPVPLKVGDLIWLANEDNSFKIDLSNGK